MPRPSLQQERKQEILDALERCIVRFGVEGAGLQKIADEAGLARPLIRHHVGNRDDLLRELVDRFIQRSDDVLAGMAKVMPAKGRADFLLEMLFSPSYRGSEKSTQLYQALAMAAETRPWLRQRLNRWNSDFLELLRTEVAGSFPNAEGDAAEEVAVGIMALYFNADSMAVLAGGQDIYTQSWAAARRLLATLS